MNLDALELRVPPPVVGLLVAAAMWGLAPWGLPMAWPPGLRMGAAVVLVALGLVLDMSGLVAFVRRHTTINPLRPANSSALVTGGVYRFTRNPMYLGMACLLSAWAVWLGSLAGFAGPLVFVLYITRFQIRPEERILGGLFGQAFTDYCERVRRWI
jgi:protein-S-isoprenylcysteine O-methyltransferase Ste14